ncbi:hypothetical protein DPMN_009593 [Dreissena polymorpha]|uniref:Uncharacterized protein n=1 Tax=Dreissena polymorpha TaxID=45954 RepID=A0A9D4S095_DREPO|nr:hypothetical protein DPMN_009593 [Dreissena polymorpha]
MIGQKNVTSRVLTSFFTIYIYENAPPPCSHVFYDDWATIVTSRVFTRTTGGHTNIFTNFKLNRGIIGTNLLTKFHDDRTRNPNKPNFPAHWRPCFSTDKNHFEIIRHIIKQTFLQSYMKIGHEIFERVRCIIGTNLLTKFHKDRTRNVASKAFTRKTALCPLAAMFFQRTGTTFELTNISLKQTFSQVHEDWALKCDLHFRTLSKYHCYKYLTKFHEDRTRNVASRVFTNTWTDDGRTDVRRTKTDKKSSPEQSVDKNYTRQTDRQTHRPDQTTPDQTTPDKTEQDKTRQGKTRQTDIVNMPTYTSDTPCELLG